MHVDTKALEVPARKLAVCCGLGMLLTLAAAAAVTQPATAPVHTVALGEVGNTSGFSSRGLDSTWTSALEAALRRQEGLVVASPPGAPPAGERTPVVSARFLILSVITKVETERTDRSGGVAVSGIRLRVGGGPRSRVQLGVSLLDAATGEVLATTEVAGESRRRSLSIDHTAAGQRVNLEARQQESLGRAIEDAALAVAEWVAARLPEIPSHSAVAEEAAR